MKIPFRLSFYFLCVLTILAVIVLSHSFQEGFLHQIERKTYDLRMSLRPQKRLPQDVVIADIDEKSLRTYGRWPWSRGITAKLIQKLHGSNVRAIAFDMVFAEKDAHEDLSFARDLAKSIAEGRPDPTRWKKSSKQERESILKYFSKIDEELGQISSRRSPDEEFAKALTLGTPVILGMIPNQDKDPPEDLAEKKQQIASSMICPEAEKLNRYIKNFSGVITSLDIFAHERPGYGFFNYEPDPDGTARFFPMAIRIGSSLYPSLSLETTARALGVRPNCTAGIEGIGFIDLGDHHIPTNGSGQIAINYYGKHKYFPYYSISDILEDKIPKDALQGRIVLVGSSAPGILDLRITPLSRIMPGVEIHATVIQNILDDYFMQRKTTAFLVDTLILLCLGLLCVLVLPRVNALLGAAFACITFVSYCIFDWFFFFKRGYWFFLFFPLLMILSLYLVITLVNYLKTEASARAERKKRAQLKSAFQHYVSSSLVDEILKKPEQLKLGGERRNLTVLFSDVRGFTTLSERLTPEALVDLLNEYLTPMTDVILTNQGMLDKYIGDAIMAVFGAPLPMEKHAAQACLSAVGMMQRLNELHEKWRARSIPPLQIGIGINTGDMSVGNMGSEQRFDYTVMGDHVNLGSRLEGVNKIFGTCVIVSEFTQQSAGKNFIFRELDRLQVKGKTMSVTIFELLGSLGQAPPYALELSERFQVALTSYRKKDWDKATKDFESILAFHPEDGPTKTFLERIGYFRLDPPAESWDGTFQMKTK